MQSVRSWWRKLGWKEAVAQPCTGKADCDGGITSCHRAAGGSQRFMLFLERTAHQNGSSHPPPFWPTTWTVSARFTHLTSPSHGTLSAESAAFTTKPFCCCSFLHLARKTRPCGTTSRPEISVQAPQGMVGHNDPEASGRENKISFKFCKMKCL